MKRKLIYGVGLNDQTSTNDRHVYTRWHSMLRRCYAPNQANENPSYIGCSVHSDFIKYSDFHDWFIKQVGSTNVGWHLDKDILICSNKVYGPDTCVLVPRQLNSLLAYQYPSEYPPGVSWHKGTKKFQAKLNSDGQRIHIGVYQTPEAAHEAYKAAKLNEIHRQAAIYRDQIDPRAYAALMAYSFE